MYPSPKANPYSLDRGPFGLSAIVEAYSPHYSASYFSYYLIQIIGSVVVRYVFACLRVAWSVRQNICVRHCICFPKTRYQLQASESVAPGALGMRVGLHDSEHGDVPSS